MTSRSQPVQAPAKRRLRFTRVRAVIAELRKVVWPTRQEAIRLSIMVIIVCLILGIILGLIDFGFTTFFDKLLVGSR